MLPRMKTAFYNRTKRPPEAHLKPDSAFRAVVSVQPYGARHCEHPVTGAPKLCAASTK